MAQPRLCPDVTVWEMSQLSYSPEADAALTDLERDVARAALLNTTVGVLAAIAAEPGSADVRRRVYHVDGRAVFGVPYRTHDDDWLVMWEPDHDGPIIMYVGPDLP